MKKKSNHLHLLLAGLCTLLLAAGAATAAPPFGDPGSITEYEIATPRPEAESTVARLLLTAGPEDNWDGAAGQWLRIEMTSHNGGVLRIWLLSAESPSESLAEARRQVLRYIVQHGDQSPVEYRHAVSKRAVLPSNGAWPYLLPRPAGENAVALLGHRYTRSASNAGSPAAPPADPKLHLLRPDVLTGVPHNTRQADETRRYDDSEYEYIPLVQEDYDTMAEVGLNCYRAEPDLVPWYEERGLFYYGALDLPYPGLLYNPLYLGPGLFLDEPAVVTRDYAIRPRLREDPAFRRDINPQAAMEAFEEHFTKVMTEGAPVQYMKRLAERPDIDTGDMQFLQASLYTWETMVSSAAYQLLYDAGSPGAIVFEPPGHIGVRRTVPAWNMSYGCEIPIGGRDHFIDVIIGFVRGAARASGKEWGISIYGSVDQVDAGAFISRAYELGATRFFYWDSARLACVPFGEVLDHTRHLTRQATIYPSRDLDRLKHAAEVAILFPAGYNLGHVFMGKGMLWGVSELNLERKNRAGVTYRTVMGNLFTEIERCLRMGIAFDLLWDLPAVKPRGYREVVRIREEGAVEVTVNGNVEVLPGPRTPERAGGAGPSLEVDAPETVQAPAAITVTARVVEGDAPVYYSPIPDLSGVHHNERVLWELYGPEEEDHFHRVPVIEAGTVTPAGPAAHDVEATFNIEKPGRYRIRAATTDLAGRSAVVWRDLDVQ